MKNKLLKQDRIQGRTEFTDMKRRSYQTNFGCSFFDGLILHKE